MTTANDAAASDLVSGVMARLALRQRNLAALVPVLMHDINGSLNGLALSTELLSRLQQREGGSPASAAELLARTRNELTRLQGALKALEHRVLPESMTLPSEPAASLRATMHEVQARLMPAIRRGQHELRLALPVEDVQLGLRSEDLFDLLAGLAIVAIEGAPEQATLDARVESGAIGASVTIEHAGRPRPIMAVEMHRELLRVAVRQAGGLVEWQESGAVSRGSLRLPRV